MKIFLRNKIKAFTLIELMVTVAIIGVVISMSLAGYSGAEKKSNLDGGMRILSANFNLARSNFLSGLRYGGAIASGGWGIHLDVSSSTYLMFADMNSNGVYDSGEAIVNSGAQAFSLGNGLHFSQINLGNTLDVVFHGTSTPLASIVSGVNSSSTACVEIAESSTNRVDGLKINAFGFFETVNSCQ
ncbi:MAG: prepilin-type N-terminal cleavage/methylation domain-containing protein [Candidatus Falkowbacteria bacterium]